MPRPLAADDIAPTRRSFAGGREPLIIVDRLCDFLDARGLGYGQPTFTPLGDGHSNVTLAVRRGDDEFVVRRPPRGRLPPSAHDVLREARIVAALTGRIRLPKVLAVCDDPALIGAPFVVMTLEPGEVPVGHVPGGDGSQLGASIIEALVALHDIHPADVGLAKLGRPDRYLSRQLLRFRGLWETSRTRDVPAVESIARWLAEHEPASAATTIVHGDYRPGNLLAADSNVTAVLDWEMATVGDPLADLGYLCALWADPEDPDLGMFEMSPVTRDPTMPRRAEIVARYAQATGRDVSGIHWYEVLALWKTIVFMEGNYRRALMGLDDDPFLRRFATGIDTLIARANARI